MREPISKTDRSGIHDPAESEYRRTRSRRISRGRKLDRVGQSPEKPKSTGGELFPRTFARLTSKFGKRREREEVAVGEEQINIGGAQLRCEHNEGVRSNSERSFEPDYPSEELTDNLREIDEQIPKRPEKQLYGNVPIDDAHVVGFADYHFGFNKFEISRRVRDLSQDGRGDIMLVEGQPHGVEIPQDHPLRRTYYKEVPPYIRMYGWDNMEAHDAANKKSLEYIEALQRLRDAKAVGSSTTLENLKKDAESKWRERLRIIIDSRRPSFKDSVTESQSIPGHMTFIVAGDAHFTDPLSREILEAYNYCVVIPAESEKDFAARQKALSALHSPRHR